MNENYETLDVHIYIRQISRKILIVLQTYLQKTKREASSVMKIKILLNIADTLDTLYAVSSNFP